MSVTVCPSCGASAPVTAANCAECGARLKSSRVWILQALGIAAALAVILWVMTPGDEPEAEDAGAGTVQISTEEPRQCAARLKQLGDAGGSIARRGRKVFADEAEWQRLDPNVKRGMLNTVACASFSGRTIGVLGPGEAAVIYGLQSGKELARADNDGVHETGEAPPAAD